MKNIRIRKGFTLSEVLITLGILGVVAALTIPSLNNIVPSTDKALFRKSYETLQRAVQDMLDDDTIYPDDMTVKTGDFDYPRGFNYDSAIGAGTTNKFCYYLVQRLNVTGATACPATTVSTTTTKFATTMDGVDWYIYPGDTTTLTQFPMTGNTYTTKVIVDVNGAKKPNCLTDSGCATYKPSTSSCTCTNPDTFIIGVQYDGKLRAGNSSSDPTSTGNTDDKALAILNAPLDNTK